MAHTPMFRRLIRVLQLARRENLKAQGQSASLKCMQVNHSRRNFLKTTGVASASSLFTTTFPGTMANAFAASTNYSPTVAVIGAGLAGLNAAYQLKKAGIVANVYEASHRLGGRVFSNTGIMGEGLVTELGGEFINSDHQDMLDLVQDFGLSLFSRYDDAVTTASVASGYYFEGAAWPEAELAELLRPLAEQITNDADLLDLDWDFYAAKFDQYSVSDYLDYHAALIPYPFIRTLIENTIRTEYGAEPGQSSALQLLFNLPTVDGNKVELLGYSDEAFTVEGGNSLIVSGLAQALEGQIQTGMALTHLENNDNNGFKLHFKNTQEVAADYVILAIPFTVLRHVELEIPLPKNLRCFINDVNLGRNEKLLAGYAERIWRQGAGFSLEAWTDLGFSEVWDATQRQAARQDGALTYYLGGEEVNKTLQWGNTSGEIGGEFTKRLSAFVPGLEYATTGRYAQTKWSKNKFSHGAYTNFQPGQLTNFGDYFWIEAEDPAEQQTVNVKNLIFAGEHLSDEYWGFMNGGAQTGRLAAQLVQALISCKKSGE